MSSRFLLHDSWQGDSSSQISKSGANNLIVNNGNWTEWSAICSEIILVTSNRTCTACSFDFEIMHMISDQIALHSVQLPL